MARWILRCDNCNFEFTHSMISNQSAESYFLPEKPNLEGGVELECPNCGSKDRYGRTDLVFRDF